MKPAPTSKFAQFGHVLLFVGLVGVALIFLDILFVYDTSDLWIRQDKMLHIVACASLVFGAQALLGLSPQAATAVTAIVGAGKEIFDGPRASLRDAAADCAGIEVGLAVALLVSTDRFKRMAIPLQRYMQNPFWMLLKKTSLKHVFCSETETCSGSKEQIKGIV